MNLEKQISFIWAGFRKTSTGGSYCGWFVKVGSPSNPIYMNNTPLTKAYFFYGTKNTRITIEEHALSLEFERMISLKTKNYSQLSFKKILSKIGRSSILNEFELFMTYDMLKNG